MKKLMMIVSSLAVACSVHAASMVWGFGSPDIQDSTGQYMGDAVQGIAYLYIGTVTTDGTSFDTSSATLAAQTSQDPTTYQFGVFDAPVDNDKVSSTAAGQAFSLILVEDNGKDIASYEGNYILFNGTSDQGADPMSGAKWAIFTDYTAYGASDWSTMTAGGGGGGGGQGGIPEPTSGLLLLVGGAMLALRRKQK